MIEVKNIKKSYGTLQVLKGIDLIIPEKQIVTIVGASGAGKSTLLHIIGTLDYPDEGEVWYEQDNVAHYSANNYRGKKQRAEDAKRRKRLDTLEKEIAADEEEIQFHHLLPEFTALENVCMPAWIKGVPRKEAEKKALGLLELMGLQDRISHKPSELSGGEQQRVSVARALINSPKVVLADEPSGNLDTHTKNELHQLFFSLRDELGQTFVIVTHDTELAEMADSKICLSDGQIKG